MNKQKEIKKIVNNTLKNLLDLQLIFFDEQDKFDIVTKMILDFSVIVEEYNKKEKELKKALEIEEDDQTS